MNNGYQPAFEEIELDPQKRSDDVAYFEKELKNKIIGQDRAAKQVVNMYQVCLAGMWTPGRPIGNFLFLGPTGSGKTRVVEASSEILFGSHKAFIKIDCAEFQHSHEIAKLIGSPPGYLGHRETPPLLTQEKIDQYYTDKLKLSFVLFDEIEKASEAVWQLLLGILDKATLTLGDNRQVDFSRCVIFMTSNLGASEISRFISGDVMGFVHKPTLEMTDPDTDKKIYRVALEEAKKKFSPEFMNRIDRVVVFRALTQEHLRQILDIELNEVQCKILATQGEKLFIFQCTEEAKNFLLREGTDLKYGARHLKRAIERHLVFPLSNLIVTKQIGAGDVVKAGFNNQKNELKFSKEKKIGLVAR